MKKPSYELADYQATYDYHRTFHPNKLFARSAARLINHIMQPEVTYAPDSAEVLHELQADSAPQIYALNHLSNLHDQWTAAAIAQQIAPDQVGDIRVLAKDSFYNGRLLAQLGVPGKLHRFAQPLMTSFVNHMGTVPVSRSKNHEGNSRLSWEASQYMFDSLGELLEEGYPVAGYFESTHNYAHPETNLPLKSGIGHLATRTLQPGRTPAAIVPIGVSYGRDYTPIGEGLAKPNRVRRAQVYIGKIALVERDMSVGDITRMAAAHLQDATDHAFEQYDARTLS